MEEKQCQSYTMRITMKKREGCVRNETEIKISVYRTYEKTPLFGDRCCTL